MAAAPSLAAMAQPSDCARSRMLLVFKFQAAAYLTGP